MNQCRYPGVEGGDRCFTIVYNILSNKENTRQGVSGTWLAAWNAVPPWHLGSLLKRPAHRSVPADRQAALCLSLRRFVDGLSENERQAFLRRYWYLDSTAEMAAQMGASERKIKTMLMRTRGKLRAELEKEGLL
ncbi:MAG: sigma factor-like helix-turn-helix DNA-binding protein [Eubacteriales bacterium]|nr:sigma factor-like helix-turn-helix DNA-binding protein [Eubacteriales bacterium]